MQNNIPQRKLFKCKNCLIYFAWPRLTKETLNQLYSNGNSEIWHYELDERRDWQIALDWIQKSGLKNSKILDIGCWDGSFLENVTEQELYGIEINPIAAEKSKKKGIKILADNLYEIENLSHSFDVVTAFDVIEHIEDPYEFIKSVNKITKKNGYIIISSGNTENWTWKISKSRYLYCANVEHISFINYYWCNYVANKLKLDIVKIEKFSHSNSSNLKNTMLSILKNFIYLFMPSLIAFGRKLKYSYSDRFTKNFNYPPSWGNIKDHILVIFKKN